MVTTKLQVRDEIKKQVEVQVTQTPTEHAVDLAQYLLMVSASSQLILTVCRLKL